MVAAQEINEPSAPRRPRWSRRRSRCGSGNSARWMVNYFQQSSGGKKVHTYVDAIAIDPFPEKLGHPEDAYALMQDARKQLAKIGRTQALLEQRDQLRRRGCRCSPPTSGTPTPSPAPS